MKNAEGITAHEMAVNSDNRDLADMFVKTDSRPLNLGLLVTFLCVAEKSELDRIRLNALKIVQRAEFKQNRKCK